jgi:hypothetical protein
MVNKFKILLVMALINHLLQYNSYKDPRQHCWSHLDRDFEKIAERDDVDGHIEQRLKEEADEVFLFWRYFKEGITVPYGGLCYSRCESSCIFGLC